MPATRAIIVAAIALACAHSVVAQLADPPTCPPSVVEAAWKPNMQLAVVASAYLDTSMGNSQDAYNGAACAPPLVTDPTAVYPECGSSPQLVDTALTFTARAWSPDALILLGSNAATNEKLTTEQRRTNTLASLRFMARTAMSNASAFANIVVVPGRRDFPGLAIDGFSISTGSAPPQQEQALADLENALTGILPWTKATPPPGSGSSEEARQTFLRLGCYAVNASAYGLPVTFIVLNTALFSAGLAQNADEVTPSLADVQIEWLEDQMVLAQATHRQAIILGELSTGIDSGSGLRQWARRASSDFRAIVDRYCSSLAALLVAESFRAQMRILGGTTCTAPLLSMGSLAPLRGTNPTVTKITVSLCNTRVSAWSQQAINLFGNNTRAANGIDLAPGLTNPSLFSLNQNMLKYYGSADVVVVSDTLETLLQRSRSDSFSRLEAAAAGGVPQRTYTFAEQRAILCSQLKNRVSDYDNCIAMCDPMSTATDSAVWTDFPPQAQFETHSIWMLARCVASVLFVTWFCVAAYNQTKRLEVLRAAARDVREASPTVAAILIRELETVQEKLTTNSGAASPERSARGANLSGAPTNASMGAASQRLDVEDALSQRQSSTSAVSFAPTQVSQRAVTTATFDWTLIDPDTDEGAPIDSHGCAIGRLAEWDAILDALHARFLWFRRAAFYRLVMWASKMNAHERAELILVRRIARARENFDVAAANLAEEQGFYKRGEGSLRQPARLEALEAVWAIYHRIYVELVVALADMEIRGANNNNSMLSEDSFGSVASPTKAPTSAVGSGASPAADTPLVSQSVTTHPPHLLRVPASRLIDPPFDTADVAHDSDDDEDPALKNDDSELSRKRSDRQVAASWRAAVVELAAYCATALFQSAHTDRIRNCDAYGNSKRLANATSTYSERGAESPPPEFAQPAGPTAARQSSPDGLKQRGPNAPSASSGKSTPKLTPAAVDPSQYSRDGVWRRLHTLTAFYGRYWFNARHAPPLRCIRVIDDPKVSRATFSYFRIVLGLRILLGFWSTLWWWVFFYTGLPECTQRSISLAGTCLYLIVLLLLLIMDAKPFGLSVVMFFGMWASVNELFQPRQATVGAMALLCFNCGIDILLFLAVWSNSRHRPRIISDTTRGSARTHFMTAIECGRALDSHGHIVRVGRRFSSDDAAASATPRAASASGSVRSAGPDLETQPLRDDSGVNLADSFDAEKALQLGSRASMLHGCSTTLVSLLRGSRQLWLGVPERGATTFASIGDSIGVCLISLFASAVVIFLTSEISGILTDAISIIKGSAMPGVQINLPHRVVFFVGVSTANLALQYAVSAACAADRRSDGTLPLGTDGMPLVDPRRAWIATVYPTATALIVLLLLAFVSAPLFWCAAGYAVIVCGINVYISAHGDHPKTPWVIASRFLGSTETLPPLAINFAVNTVNVATLGLMAVLLVQAGETQTPVGQDFSNYSLQLIFLLRAYGTAVPGGFAANASMATLWILERSRAAWKVARRRSRHAINLQG